MVRTALIALSLSAALACAGDMVPGPDLATRLTESSRSDDDKARDAGRRPAEVIAFLQIAPGMTVMDVIAAGGYYTEVLSIAVGPEGRVYAQNPQFVLEFRDGANDKAMTARLAGARLPNVQRADTGLEDIKVADGSLDAAITALNFHDIYNGRGEQVALAFLIGIHRMLKPGGLHAPPQCAVYPELVLLSTVPVAPAYLPEIIFTRSPRTNL